MDKEDIRKAVISILEGRVPLVSAWCEVKAVNETTCDVIVDDDSDLVLKGILLGYDKSGAVVTPEVGTDVLVLFVNNTKTNGVVVMVEKTAAIDIFGKNFGKIPVTSDIVERLNNIENDLNNFKTALAQCLSPIVPEPGNGANSALQAVMIAQLGGYAAGTIDVTEDSDIEGEVQHGNGQ